MFPQRYNHWKSFGTAAPLETSEPRALKTAQTFNNEAEKRKPPAIVLLFFREGRKNIRQALE